MEKDEVFRLDMKMPQNPFVYNAPVRGEDFFNREETIIEILKETVTGKSQGTVWVVGERQVGKTSLLRYLQSYYKDSPEKIEFFYLYQLSRF
jgi:polynucleotide 5'-kinase involved in rRNA processing